MGCNKMDIDTKISFPNEIIETMTFEQTLFSPENNQVGIAIFSEVENSNHIVRVYHLSLDADETVYNFIQELAAFSYQSRNEVDDFIKHLPTLSGIEMLLMLHPIEPAHEYLN